jgi:hypothetical protein
MVHRPPVPPVAPTAESCAAWQRNLQSARLLHRHRACDRQRQPAHHHRRGKCRRHRQPGRQRQLRRCGARRPQHHLLSHGKGHPAGGKHPLQLPQLHQPHRLRHPHQRQNSRWHRQLHSGPAITAGSSFFASALTPCSNERAPAEAGARSHSAEAESCV